MSKSRWRILAIIAIAFAVNITRDWILKSGTLPAFLPTSLSGSLDYLTNKKTIVQHITDYTQVTDLENDMTRNIERHWPTLVRITPLNSTTPYNGTIITSDGFVLSSRLPQAATYTVETSDGNKYTLTGMRSHPVLPISFLRLPLSSQDEDVLPHAQLSSSSKAADLGTFVHAILPTPQPHLLFGIVDTFVPAGSDSTLLPILHASFLESASAANGTPLFSHRGELIGLFSDTKQNTAEILPISTAMIQDMLTSITTSWTLQTVVWGATFTPVTDQQVKLLKLPKSQGMLVSTLATDSPLLRAWLQKNDLILEIDGEKIDQAATAIRWQYRFNPGEKVSFTIFHAGKYKTLDVTF